ncbi:L-ascorbate oxidase-like [Mizuhopecten yessoensis]|uniref:L-ascorbate oxidase-like n=1 Tax=Mizuhopecten yessoensis TaxID=6573 RepID=UPI000B45A031|nr:L-ascorbate oxidase-like [Mizuhopecten yessoensis]
MYTSIQVGDRYPVTFTARLAGTILTMRKKTFLLTACVLKITLSFVLGQDGGLWDVVQTRENPCRDTTCGEKQDVCECYLIVEHRLTMMIEEEGTLVVPKGGQLYDYDKPGSPIIKAEQIPYILTADGNNSRLVITVNRRFPGPQITAYEDQTLIIHVRNLMHTDSTTVHWHGMHQQGSTFADGVAMVSQCPIGHGQEFTYKFKAKPHGTSFYHAHIGDQRTMGLYGALVVYPKQELPSATRQEHVVTLQDWNHEDDAATLYQRMLYGIYDQARKTPYKTTSSRDGAMYSRYRFHSGLVNGKGRYYTSPNVHNQAPLTEFDVAPNRNYTFRVISAATLYPFRVYVEGHPTITVVASDGFALKPMVVESFIINPGERYDFILFTDKPKDNYLLVAQTLEVEREITRRGEYHVAEAIIHYVGRARNLNLAKSGKNMCTASKKCVIFNCPYLLPTCVNEICKTFNDARTDDFNSRPQDVRNIDNEHFFNFAFPGPGGFMEGSVNGRQFVPPVSPVYSQPEDIDTQCDVNCEDRTCRCTYTQEIESGKVYQFTLTNLGNGKGWSHPVHLHGHSFYVMKMGFGQYNPGGNLTDSTADISCTRGSKGYCNSPIWADETWNGGNVPDLVLNDTAQKDTILVPTDGYVVIRFKADNPGAWFFHCHIDLHNTNGMGMVIIETPEKYPDVPKNFPVCGVFKEEENDSEDSGLGFGAGIGVGIAIILGVGFLIVVVVLIVEKCRD